MMRSAFLVLLVAGVAMFSGGAARAAGTGGQPLREVQVHEVAYHQAQAAFMNTYRGVMGIHFNVAHTRFDPPRRSDVRTMIRAVKAAQAAYDTTYALAIERASHPANAR